MDTPQIYVACLAAYNNGILHGEWINANLSVNEVYEEIYTMLANSPINGAEEYAIHDYEGFGSISISEYESIESVIEFAAFISEHGDLGAELLTSYSIEEAEKLLQDNYMGVYDSEIDFACTIFDDCYSDAIPENVRFYIDYEAFSRDLFISDYFSVEIGLKSHIFSSY